MTVGVKVERKEERRGGREMEDRVEGGVEWRYRGGRRHTEGRRGRLQEGGEEKRKERGSNEKQSGKEAWKVGRNDGMKKAGLNKTIKQTKGQEGSAFLCLFYCLVHCCFRFLFGRVVRWASLVPS
jgi:hypothetical protein